MARKPVNLVEPKLFNRSRTNPALPVPGDSAPSKGEKAQNHKNDSERHTFTRKFRMFFFAKFFRSQTLGSTPAESPAQQATVEVRTTACSA